MKLPRAVVAAILQRFVVVTPTFSKAASAASSQTENVVHPRRQRKVVHRPTGSSSSSYYSLHRSLQDTSVTSDGQATTGSTSASGNATLVIAEQELRRLLLENYDRGTYPFSNLWRVTTSSNSSSSSSAEQRQRTGLPVQVGLNFHRVLSVDVTSSVVDLIVWVRQQWHDPRLVWNSSGSNINSSYEQFAGIDKTNFWIGDGIGSGETSDIWTPDLQLWNMQEPLADTLADSYATVSSDGTVFWSRPGHIKAACKFKGLDKFPFDTLECTLEIGSWAYSGLYLRPTKLDGEGYSIGGSETAGESFQEFSLESVVCDEHVYPPYPSAPEEDWPVLFYHITFRRAWQPYVRGYAILQIVLNLAAFCCFWLPPHVGERMGLSITAVLAAVASELVVAANLPAASELTWFSKFSLMSLMFTALALFESAAVIYFHYYTGEDLVPRWYRWIKEKTWEINDDSGEEKKQVRFSQIHKGSENGSVANGEWNVEEVTVDKTLTHDGAKTNAESDASEDEKRKLKREADVGEQDHAPEGLSRSELTESEPTVCEVNQRKRFSFSRELKQEMSSFRTRKSIKTILGRDADDFKNAKEMENNAKWQKVAATIDEVARVAFPLAFAIFLSSTFASLAD